MGGFLNVNYCLGEKQSKIHVGIVVIQGSPHPTMNTATFQLHQVLEEKITFSFVGFTLKKT